MKLSKKHRDFADSYIELTDAKKAALKAGYSESYARSRSYDLLEKPEVKEYIAERMEQISSEKIVDIQEIMIYLTSVMRGETRNTLALGTGGGSQKLVEVQPSATERIKAAELLGKRYLMWTEKHQVEVSGGITFIDDIGSECNIAEEMKP